MNYCNTICPEKINLGCFGHCEIIDLGFNAPNGTYTYVFSISGHKVKKEIEIVDGKLNVDTSELNECASVDLEIYDSSGSLIKFTDDECTYKGFYFQIEVVKNI